MAGRKRKKHVAGVPHLFRQRGKSKLWSGLIDGHEVALGTADAAVAQRRLLDVAADRERVARAPQAVAQPLVTELAARYCDHLRPPRVTKKTAASYHSRIMMFVDWCETKAIARTDEPDEVDPFVPSWYQTTRMQREVVENALRANVADRMQRAAEAKLAGDEKAAAGFYSAADAFKAALDVLAYEEKDVDGMLVSQEPLVAKTSAQDPITVPTAGRPRRKG